MRIYLFVNREFDQNCYCVFDDTKEAVVIDPGCPADIVENFLAKESLTLKQILLTHGHFDHIISAEELSKWSGAPISASRAEASLLKDPKLNLSAYSFSRPITLMPGRWLDNGDSVLFGGETLLTIHTPGHSPGGVCFYSKEHHVIFTGDTLFWETVGRTDFNLSDGEQLTRCIYEKLLVLPGETVVYPGHGRPTDINHERMIHKQVN
ncbi:MAG: MBL fold metallo-hydrolase [Clostridiales bacterium]|nr:MBL fold metallo-hydrolase [Clostridiales bacterium]